MRSPPAFAAEYGEFGSSGASSAHEPVADAAVHLVGGDLHDARHPGVQARLQQDLDPADVRGDEVGRAGDRAVDVRLRREVDHHVVARDHRVEQRGVADVAVHEARTAGCPRPAPGWPGCPRR